MAEYEDMWGVTETNPYAYSTDPDTGVNAPPEGDIWMPLIEALETDPTSMTGVGPAGLRPGEATPKVPVDEIPSYEEWLAGYEGTNPESTYLNEFYTGVTHGGDFLTMAPTIAAVTLGGLAAGGAFDPYSLTAAESAAGAIPGATPPDAYWDMTAQAPGTLSDATVVDPTLGGEPYGVAEFGEGVADVPTMGPPKVPPVASATSLIPGVSDQLLGGIALGGFGYLGASKQTDAFKDMAEAEQARTAPYDAKLQETYDPNFDPNTIPGYSQAYEQNLEAVTRKVTGSMGNPANNPAAAAAIADSMNRFSLDAVNQYRSGLTQAAGLSTGAVPANLGAINAEGQGYNALGYGAAYGLAPPSTSMGGVITLNGVKYMPSSSGPLEINGVRYTPAG